MNEPAKQNQFPITSLAGCMNSIVLLKRSQKGPPIINDIMYSLATSFTSPFSFWIKTKTLENSDFKFKVKMNDNIESLNISYTVSVVCHHVFQSIK